MNETPTPAKNPTIKPEKAPMRPGTRLMYAGGTIAIIGAVLAIMALSTRTYDLYTGYHSGSPVGGIVVIVLGLILTGIGFGRRILAALENKGPTNS